jgi:hypothetical protein
MKLLPFKLAVFVILLFAAVITTCLLWTPVKMRYHFNAYHNLVDFNKASKAMVVLRIENIEGLGGSKYCWHKVRIINIIKNHSSYKFPTTISVATYGWHEGILPGESTIYLEQYNPDRVDLWMLLEGNGKAGASHYKEKE